MTKEHDETFVGIDLGTSRSSIATSEGHREMVESYVGWPVDMVARKLLKKPVLVGAEAIENRPMLDIHRVVGSFATALPIRAHLEGDDVVGHLQNTVEISIVDLEANGIAQLATHRQIESADPLRHLLEQPRHGDRVIEPENAGQTAAEARAHGILRAALEQLPIALPGSFVVLDVDRLTFGGCHLPAGFGVEIPFERFAQRGTRFVDHHREAEQRCGVLRFEKDPLRLRQHLDSLGYRQPEVLRCEPEEAEVAGKQAAKCRRSHHGRSSSGANGTSPGRRNQATMTQLQRSREGGA